MFTTSEVYMYLCMYVCTYVMIYHHTAHSAKPAGQAALDLLEVGDGETAPHFALALVLGKPAVEITRRPDGQLPHRLPKMCPSPNSTRRDSPSRTTHGHQEFHSSFPPPPFTVSVELRRGKMGKPLLNLASRWSLSAPGRIPQPYVPCPARSIGIRSPPSELSEAFPAENSGGSSGDPVIGSKSPSPFVGGDVFAVVGIVPPHRPTQTSPAQPSSAPKLS